jgi:hypothetical protein
VCTRNFKITDIIILIGRSCQKPTDPMDPSTLMATLRREIFFCFILR